MTKLEITGKIKVESGMHIGGSSAFSAIGSVDSPIIKDSISGLPMIPGSSLKGKLRYLLNRSLTELRRKDLEEMESLNKNLDHNDDADEVLRLFGSSRKGNIKKSRLIFSDMILSNEKDLYSKGAEFLTEVKFENTINRLTAVANPRQIERCIRGSEFDLNIIYNVDNVDELVEDMELLIESLKLLEYDYLGGNGTRGYGRVKIEGLNIEPVVGKLDGSKAEEVKELVENF